MQAFTENTLKKLDTTVLGGYGATSESRSRRLWRFDFYCIFFKFDHCLPIKLWYFKHIVRQYVFGYQVTKNE